MFTYDVRDNGICIGKSNCLPPDVNISFFQAWNVYGVLNFLQALVEKSMIIQILEQEKEGLEQFTATDGYDYNGGSNVLKVLGYFSMIGLLRVHCLLGDYHTGLKCLLPIDLSQQGVYTSVIGSHIATIYHYGFANLMLRRYAGPMNQTKYVASRSSCLSNSLICFRNINCQTVICLYCLIFPIIIFCFVAELV